MEINLLNPPTLWDAGEYDVYKERSISVRTKRALTPSLHSVLDSYGAFPPYSLLIGMCTDRLPFMLSLDNPKSGSILVVGDQGCGKTSILRTMAISACIINHPQDVKIYVISSRAREYSDILNFPHCAVVLDSYDRAAGELVIELASISEQRRSGRERGEMMMLIIDDFAGFEDMLGEYSVYLNLKSLISRGSLSGVWPMIAINPNDVQEKRGQLLRSFGTYIFEKSEFDPQRALEGGHDPAGETILQPNFDAIIGGRLVPITNLSV
jgi:energy-coupling factor transporter ATP-binding protein EcfA2